MLKKIWHYLFGNPNKSIVKDQSEETVKYLIVGLGNIGAEYEETRHNVGFKAADAIVESMGGTYQSERYGAVAVCKSKGRIYIVLKPSTYMNLSGQAIRYWLQKEKIEIENLLVILDDLNLDFGTIRIKGKGGGVGSQGGIVGLRSIHLARLCSRQRLGVRRPRGLFGRALGGDRRNERSAVGAA